MIAIVDYGMGNLRSVHNALRALGADPRLVADRFGLNEATAIVLPGVGAFETAMDQLRRRNLVDALHHEVIEGRKPFIGLCLGMQLMATESLEHGRHRGLGWIPGTVRPLPAAVAGSPVRVPHMGWNDLEVVRGDGLLRQMSKSPTHYYVHSYHFDPADASVVTGYCTHGIRFASIIERENLFGTQFHPEKSQKDGLALLRAFLDLARVRC